jgi:hypothetical protein
VVSIKSQILKRRGQVATTHLLCNKCIYTKQISATGAAILNKYSLQEEAQPTLPTYVTKEEFDNIINQLRDSIEAKNNNIKPVTQTVEIPNF